VNVAVCFLGKPNAVEHLQLPDPFPHRLGLIQPKRRAYASCGPMHGIDQDRSQGVESSHAIAFPYALLHFWRESPQGGLEPTGFAQGAARWQAPA
jgi:hypothetical protein